MRILVLGSDGQIGAPLVKYLKRKGHGVIGFDIFSSSKEDLRQPYILDDILPYVDFVFFLAFDVGGAVYLRHYQDTYGFISNNVKIMNNTFDSLRASGKPFIFASSQMSEMTHSTYGILKLIGERYTRECNGMIVKLWNVYGPEKNTIKTHVITDFINMARQGEIEMKTTGEEMRQFLFVDDCCECLEILMNKFSRTEYDISNFRWIKIKDLAGIISQEIKCKIVPGVLTDDVQRSKLNEPRYDILSLWKPRTSLREGIRKCIMSQR